MPQTYACRTCGKSYSLKEYENNRFCPDCGTFLLPSGMASEVLKRTGRRVTGKITESRMLPESYETRKGQTEFIQEAAKAVEDRDVFIGSAPCGVGKSLASLLAVLPQLAGNRLMICFRTRSQLHIYLKELKALSRDLRCVSLFSKQDMCPLKTKGDLGYFDFFEECRRLRENCETPVKPYCRFYMNILRAKREAEDAALDCARRILAPEESVEFISKRGFCAYEALKRVMPKADVFLGTYHYAFDPTIRDSMLKSLGVSLSKVFLIVDEAHNLPTFARELLSDRLTEGTVERALTETETFENELSDSVKQHLRVLEREVFQRAQSTLKAEELKLLNPQELSDVFAASNSASGPQVADVFQEYGVYVKKKRLEAGSDRISSYNHRIGTFMENFFSNVGPKHVHLIEKDRNNRVGLEVRNLDGRELVNPVLRETRGTILMSGFLSPPTVYRDLSLYNPDNVCMREFDSPFPRENRLILAAEDVSSELKRRTDEMLKKWKNYVEAISEATQGNLAVFFTSYGLMHEVAGSIKTKRRTIMEEQKTRRNEVIEKLKNSSNNILYGVMGAKLSEGMDYPGNVLKCVVTVGLPLATWNAYQESLIDYLEQQFPQRGRTYAYLAPAVLRLVQTCGRVHRSAKDRGCIAMLDERVTQPHIKRQLPNYFQREMTIVRNPSECAERVKNFWACAEQSPSRWTKRPSSMLSMQN